PLLDAVVTLDRAGAAEHLFALTEHRLAAVRAAASALLPGYVRPEDERRVLTLAESPRSESRQLAATLLAGFGSAAAREALVDRLGDEKSAVAFAAAESASRSPSPELRELILDHARQGALDRTFGYQCLALVFTEERRGIAVPDDLAPRCVDALGSGDLFVRSAASAALAGIGYRFPDARATSYLESKVVPTLVIAVAGERYFDHCLSVHDVAARRLALLSDRDYASDGHAWMRWWSENAGSFRANRSAFELRDDDLGSLAIDIEREAHVVARNAPAPDATAARDGLADRETSRPADRGASVAVERAGTRFTIRGERAAAGPAAIDDEDFTLAPEELEALAARLRDSGLLSPAVLPGLRGRGDVALRIRVRDRGQRKELAVADGASWPELEAVAVAADGLRNANLWQRYRDPRGSADRAAYFADEREFLAREKDPDARAGRLLLRILQALPALTGPRRAAAFRDLAAIPGLDRRLSEDQAVRGARLLREDDPAGGDAEATLRIVDVVSAVATPRVYDELVAAAADRPRPEARRLLARAMSRFGAGYAKRSLDDPRSVVRTAAVENLGGRADSAFTPSLVAALDDDSEEVRLAAAAALAEARDPGAVPALVSHEANASPAMKRAILLALGRLGGTQAFEALLAAAQSDDGPLRRAAIQGLGQLRDPRAADLLARQYARMLDPRTKDPEEAALVRNSLLALGHAGRERAERVRAALRRYLDDPAAPVRREIALAMADLGDGGAVPALIQGLGTADARVRAALTELTCVDLFSTPDPERAYRDWWEEKRHLSPAAWFTEACARSGLGSGIPASTLESEAALAAVPALCEVLESADEWCLRTRAANYLELATGQTVGRVDRFTRAEDRKAIADRYRAIFDERR
ncbi:MAG TPA: HEAT repeat domain-containing protein, partial [Planctomycetota bacterium]|nr:HEAT repeat domain-containing protein [Planctomycetota bacterium]